MFLFLLLHPNFYNVLPIPIFFQNNFMGRSYTLKIKISHVLMIPYSTWQFPSKTCNVIYTVVCICIVFALNSAAINILHLLVFDLMTMLCGAHIKFGSYFKSHVKHFCIMQLYITIIGYLPDNKQSSSFYGTSGPYNNWALG